MTGAPDFAWASGKWKLTVGRVFDPSVFTPRTGQRPVLRVSQFLPLALLVFQRIFGASRVSAAPTIRTDCLPGRWPIRSDRSHSLRRGPPRKLRQREVAPTW